MIFKNASTILGCSNLQAPALNALIPDENNYSVLMFQPKGNIQADANGLKNCDANLANIQFSKFLEKANLSQSDLVITPEYSLPWDVLATALDNGLIPDEGKLWVLGCESFKVCELENIKALLSPHAEVLFETLHNPEQQRFFSPLAYVFKTRSSIDNSERLVVLIQFKTFPLSDSGHFEVNSMQRGTIVYRFGGNNNTISLISLICSDSLAWQETHTDEAHRRYLILHIQFNKDPRHDQFRAYRESIFGRVGDDTEIVCLNWASNVVLRIEETDVQWKNIAGTAWYLKPDKFDSRDNVLATNHKLGLYYTWHKVLKCHCLYFNYEPAMFLLQATKTYHHSVQANMSRRRGPQLTSIYHWESTKGEWNKLLKVDDGFAKAAEGIKGLSRSIKDIGIETPISAERALALSVGKVSSDPNWYEPKHMDSYIIDSSEVVNRITFAQDTNTDAVNFRKVRISRTNHLCNILSNRACVPSSIRDFDSGFKFSWIKETPHQNAISSDDKRATVIYLGEDSTEQEQREIKSTIAKRLQESAATDDESIGLKQRLIVWYRDQAGNLAIFQPNEYTRFDQSRTDSESDLAREN